MSVYCAGCFGNFLLKTAVHFMVRVRHYQCHFKNKVSVCLFICQACLSVSNVCLKLGKEFSWFSYFVTLKFNGAQKCAFRTWVLLRAQSVWSIFQRRQIVREWAHKNAQRCALFGNSFCCMPTFFPIFCVFADFLSVSPLFCLRCTGTSCFVHGTSRTMEMCIRCVGADTKFVVGNSFCCVHMFSNHCGVFSPFLHLFALMFKLHWNFLPSSWDI